MAINTDTIISSYDERLTLLQWLKKLEGAIADFDLEKYYTKDEVLALLANKVNNAEFNEFKATTRDGYRNLRDALDGLANTKADVSALNNVIGNVDELDGKVGNLEVEISEKADANEVAGKQSQLYVHRISYNDSNFQATIQYLLQNNVPIGTLSGVPVGQRLVKIVSLIGQNNGSPIYEYYFNSSNEEIVTLAVNGAVKSLSNSLAVPDIVTAL